MLGNTSNWFVRFIIEAQNKAAGVMRDASGQLDGMAKKLEGVQKAAKIGFAAVSGAVALSINAFAQFDDAMTKSLAIMGDVSDEMRKKMEDAAKDVARTTTFSASQAAEAYYFLASAGLDAETSIQSMPAVAKFAQAGAFDLARATDLLTDAQSALGLTIRDDAVANMENMIRVSDILVKANTLANASVQQFSEALTNRAGAALRLVNKDVEEGIAVLAAMADQGVKGAEAGTRLDIVLRDLQVSSIKNREEWDSFGISVYNAEGNLKNMADIIGDLTGLLTDMSDEQVRTTLMTLGFQDRSVASLLTLIGLQDQIRNYETALRQAGGTTEEVADKQLESAAAKFKLLRDNINLTAIELGGALAPALFQVMEQAMPFIQATAKWIELNTEKAASITKWVLALLGAVVVLPKVLAFLKGIIAVTKWIIVSWPKFIILAKSLKIAIASLFLASNPIGWAILAGGALMFIMTRFKAVGEAFNTYIKEPITSFFERFATRRSREAMGISPELEAFMEKEDRDKRFTEMAGQARRTPFDSSIFEQAGIDEGYARHGLTGQQTIVNVNFNEAVVGDDGIQRLIDLTKQTIVQDESLGLLAGR